MREDTSSSIIAHRCLGFSHPENSLKAIRSALASGVDGIEIDVRLTKDHKWIVLHNPFFKSEERSVLRVHEHTYGSIRREVTPLDTVLALFAATPKRELFIDVKDIGEEKQLIKLIHQYGLAEAVVVIAWEPEILRRVHARDPAIRIGMSFVPVSDMLKFVRGDINTQITKHRVVLSFNKEHSFDAKHSVGASKQHYLSSLPDLPLYSIQIPALLCSSKLVRLAHERGIKVYPFGVTPLNRLLLRRCAIDGIITNHARRFI